MMQVHEFFADINWDAMMRKEILPDYQPEVKNTDQGALFDAEFTREKVLTCFECSYLSVGGCYEYRCKIRSYKRQLLCSAIKRPLKTSHSNRTVLLTSDHGRLAPAEFYVNLLVIITLNSSFLSIFFLLIRMAVCSFYCGTVQYFIFRSSLCRLITAFLFNIMVFLKNMLHTYWIYKFKRTVIKTKKIFIIAYFLV
jgi:hypothetical protein